MVHLDRTTRLNILLAYIESRNITISKVLRIFFDDHEPRISVSPMCRLGTQWPWDTVTLCNFRLPRVKRNWGLQRTQYHAVLDFNSLSQTIKDSKSVNSFKRDVFKFII